MAKIKFQDIILKETEDYIIVNKPPFISSLEDRANQINMLALAKDYCQDCQLCHRLDKETSGVLVIAKNAEAYRHLSIQFENRTVKKVYLAVADGIHDFKDIRYDQPIYKLSNGSVRVDKRGKDAVTYFKTLHAYKYHTLIECKPVTGRMHQIRIHLAHLKAPITGDTQYGGKPLLLSSIKKKYNLKKYTEEQPLTRRVALHAQMITFEAVNGEILIIEAPQPKDFKVLVHQLDKNS